MATTVQPQAGLTPHKDEVRAFLEGTVRNEIQLVAIGPEDGSILGKWFGDDAKAAVDWAADQNLRGRNMYWSPNCVTPGLNKKATKKDITTARFVKADLDAYKDDTLDNGEARRDALTKLRELATPPSFINDCGNGLQPFWRLLDEDAEHDAVERVDTQVRDRFNGDAVQNIDRVMRLPGTVNYPNERKRNLGLVPVMAVAVVADKGRAYLLQDLATAFPHTELKPPPKRATELRLVGCELLTADDLGIEPISPLRSVIEGPPGLDRSADVLRCAGDLNRAGFSKTQVLGVLMNPANPVSAHVLDQADPRRAALRAITKAFDDRPVIQVRAGELHSMATAGETALIDAGAPIYVRGGLVRPIVDVLSAAHGRRTHVARLAEVDVDMLRDQLSRVARWERFDGRSQQYKPIDPPRDVASTILGRDGEWRLPTLAGLITTPTLRPDGSILSEPGYDSATRLLLLNPPLLPPIAQVPSKAEAAAALQLLDGLLDGFPFVDRASRAVALSMLITPIVRGAMTVAPLHVANAPMAGSGKSYLVDIASTILSGERAPVIAAGRTEEETEKRLGSALLQGQSIVSIDNVNGNLGGDALCQMIERPRVAIRPLGVSKLVYVESRSTAFATGNNIKLVEDMTRRAIVSSLDPNMERPEFRVFASNPLEAVLADRGAYVAAALTVVRAYIAQGYPGVLPALASFEEWSNTVRSALVWLGHADPVDTMEAARAGDPAAAVLRSVLQAWHAALGHEGMLLKELKERVAGVSYEDKFEDLHQALSEVAQGRHGEIDTRTLGGFLTRSCGRIIDGLKLVANLDSHAKQLRWKVLRVERVDAGVVS